MQKTTFFYLLTIILLFFNSSCKELDRSETSEKKEGRVEIKYSTFSYDVSIIEIDNCEYIFAKTGDYQGGVSIIHKQNCKFCINRIK